MSFGGVFVVRDTVAIRLQHESHETIIFVIILEAPAVANTSAAGFDAAKCRARATVLGQGLTLCQKKLKRGS